MLYKKLLIILANSTSENSFHLYRAVFHSCFFRILIENRGFPCVLISRLIVMLLLALRLWLHLVTCLLGNKECGTEIHVPSSLSSQMWQKEFAGAETGRKDSVISFPLYLILYLITFKSRQNSSYESWQNRRSVLEYVLKTYFIPNLHKESERGKQEEN